MTSILLSPKDLRGTSLRPLDVTWPSSGQNVTIYTSPSNVVYELNTTTPNSATFVNSVAATPRYLFLTQIDPNFLLLGNLFRVFLGGKEKAPLYVENGRENGFFHPENTLLNPFLAQAAFNPLLFGDLDDGGFFTFSAEKAARWAADKARAVEPLLAGGAAPPAIQASTLLAAYLPPEILTTCDQLTGASRIRRELLEMAQAAVDDRDNHIDGIVSAGKRKKSEGPKTNQPPEKKKPSNQKMKANAAGANKGAFAALFGAGGKKKKKK